MLLAGRRRYQTLKIFQYPCRMMKSVFVRWLDEKILDSWIDMCKNLAQ